MGGTPGLQEGSKGVTGCADWVLPSPGTRIFIQLTHCHDALWCDDFVLFDAFDFQAETRWSFLHDSYAEAHSHAQRLGLANDRMRDFQMNPLDPYFWYEILVFRPGETFREFFPTKFSLYH